MVFDRTKGSLFNRSSTWWGKYSMIFIVCWSIIEITFPKKLLGFKSLNGPEIEVSRLFRSMHDFEKWFPKIPFLVCIFILNQFQSWWKPNSNWCQKPLEASIYDRSKLDRHVRAPFLRPDCYGSPIKYMQIAQLVSATTPHGRFFFEMYISPLATGKIQSNRRKLGHQSNLLFLRFQHSSSHLKEWQRTHPICWLIAKCHFQREPAKSRLKAIYNRDWIP